jgi:hypothetical protein
MAILRAILRALLCAIPHSILQVLEMYAVRWAKDAGASKREIGYRCGYRCPLVVCGAVRFGVVNPL